MVLLIGSCSRSGDPPAGFGRCWAPSSGGASPPLLPARRWAGSTCSQQAATCPDEIGTSGGTSRLQISMAWGQRGWKRHPLGGEIRLGGAPLPATLGGC